MKWRTHMSIVAILPLKVLVPEHRVKLESFTHETVVSTIYFTFQISGSSYASLRKSQACEIITSEEHQTCHVSVETLDLNDLLAQSVTAGRKTHRGDSVRHQHQT